MPNRPSVIELVTVADPPSATNFILTVPVGERWRIICANMTWNTSATAGTRVARFSIDSNASNTYIFSSERISLTTISVGFDLNLVPGFYKSDTAPDGANSMRLAFPPNLILQGNGSIRTIFTFIAGDNISNIKFYVEKL